MNRKYNYDVAISFAEEDRNAALALALALEIRGFKKVYYYPNQRAATWGRELKIKLESIFSTEARYAIVLLSNNYFDMKKEYTPIELAAIKKRINEEVGIVYMLPVKLNINENLEKHIDLSKGYLNWQYNPKKIAGELIRCLGKPFPPPHKIKINIKL